MTDSPAFDPAFADLVAEGLATVAADGDGSAITVPSAKLFDEGQATLSPLGETIVARASKAFGGLPVGAIQVRGHTDGQPVHSLQFPSNWEFAFAQAIAVRRVLEEQGLGVAVSVASYGGRDPIGDNETPEGRKANRRVVFALTPVRAPATLEPEL